jgi:Kef-type K+ transport system membrane component KefB
MVAMSAPELSVIFFLQMFVILAVCRLVGWLGGKLGQPQVVGEMVAGVVMGPSMLGVAFPELQKHLFPAQSFPFLYIGAQLGVGLYMFLVGLEFNTALFRTRARSAAAVSIAGIVVPFACAVGLAPWLLREAGLFPSTATQFEATLFLGAAIAITAFPVLARIIYERGLTGTALGTLALAAGAIDDAAAWCLLAIVLASFQRLADGSTNLLMVAKVIGGGAAYAAVVLGAGGRLLAPLGRIAERDGRISPALLGVVLMLFCLGAWATDAIGLHAVFGGFLLGTAMPRGSFARELRQKLLPFAAAFLVPMFFTFSGLNTRLDMVNTPQLWLIAAVVLAASILGKGGACWVAARLTGEDNRTALGLATLMNSRGMMELILINIGLQKGIIEPALFSILALMAIVTTLMASPLFERVYGRDARRSGELPAAAAEA